MQAYKWLKRKKLNSFRILVNACIFGRLQQKLEYLILEMDFLDKILDHLQQNKFIVIRDTGSRYCAVSLVLRINPHIKTAPNITCTESSHSFQDFLKLEWVKNGTLELLFMKRAISPRDRWSGEISFPGGGKEKDENAKQTAIRETFEEVGLDLNDLTKFVYLGRLHDQRTVGKVVSPIVFLQTCEETPPMNLQTSEVDSVRWAPLPFFLNTDLPNCNRVMTWEEFASRASSKTMKRLGQFLGLSVVQFPGAMLPINDDKESKEYLLWGMSYAITSEFLELGGRKPLSLTWTTNSIIMDGLFRFLSFLQTARDKLVSKL